jgi:hypothetical protein
MKFIMRVLILVGTVALVVALLFGGLALGTGNLNFLSSLGFPTNLGSIEVAPGSAPNGQEPLRQSTTISGTATVLSITWRGDQIVLDDQTISDEDFADLLAEAKSKDIKVEIIKHSDVRVEAADRWRQMLDNAGVRYEVIPQE